MEIALINVIGIAMSKGQGVAITKTARKRNASPEKYQVANANKRAIRPKNAQI